MTALTPYIGIFGLALTLLGSFLHNPMGMRTVTGLGVLLMILAMAVKGSIPIWLAAICAGGLIAAHLWAIRRDTMDRRMFRLTAEEMMLFAKFPELTPGQYKLLLTDAQWTESKVPVRLTVEGKPVEALHFVLEGKAEVERDGKRFDIGPNCFAGELAFLRGTPATATVHTKVGALHVSWPQETLRSLMKNHDGINRAISSLMSKDLAEKVAKTGLLSKV